MQTHVQNFFGAGGIRLAGEVGGHPRAPVVILLHGGGQTRHSWHGTMQELISRGYHVINLDARGHGDSEWAPDGDYTFETLARDLIEIIRPLGSRPALVGASMGGATALTLVGSHPQIASSLVLVDVVPDINEAGGERIRAFMRKHSDGFTSIEEAAAAVRAYNPRRRTGNPTGLMKNLRWHADGRLHWHWDPRLLDGLDTVEPPAVTHALAQAASRVRIPTLLARGLRSDVVTDTGVAKLRQLIPHVEVFEVPDAAHMVAGDDNDVFNNGVFRFLQRHLPT